MDIVVANKWENSLNNKELVTIYNSSLENINIKFKCNNLDELKQLPLDDLKKLLEFFMNKISNQGIDTNGEITNQGIAWDQITGILNKIIILKNK